MKAHATLTGVLLLLVSTYTCAQTKMIAHLSHSGNVNTFSFNGEGNFGLREPRLQEIVKISDTAVVAMFDFSYSGSRRDTLLNHALFSNPAISVDSLRRLWPSVDFVGFEDTFQPNDKKKQHEHVLPNRPNGNNQHNGIPILALSISILMVLLAFASSRSEVKELNIS
ncbi:MAG: hypothetical protein JKY52_18675 [Flavobacteriales bacterium]|nr:hypothetical protein [Flavobacteriales bacterium]